MYEYVCINREKERSEERTKYFYGLIRAVIFNLFGARTPFYSKFILMNPYINKEITQKYLIKKKKKKKKITSNICIES